jgi:predicted ATPase
MPKACECHSQHLRRRIVLTGGPGAGKTAVLELLRHSLCEHVLVLPESAGIVFGGGFPRRDNVAVGRCAQRAIFYVQRELEAAADAEGAGIVLCDRGTVDGIAYWPGPEDFWASVGTSRADALGRYDAVIHLRVPDADHGYGHQNPLRVESPPQARAIDDRILRAWDGHPRRYLVDATSDFITKARMAVEILRQELPECCRGHATQALHDERVALPHIDIAPGRGPEKRHVRAT